MIEHQINVTLAGDRSYPIFLGRHFSAEIFHNFPQHIALVSNPTVFKLYGEKIQSLLQQANKNVVVVIVADGESYKNIDSLSTVLDSFVDAKMKRDAGVIALGGGVIGDLAGLAASIYMRGIALMQIPTTLLAQVDAAIGGKTAINHSSGKNLIGTFYQPKAVLCDIEMLSSLPDREFNAGLAEVVKYGLLGDADFFAWLEQEKEKIIEREEKALIKMVYHSAKIKADIVMMDEKETSGCRALLNLGHTFAHGIEASTGYGEWLHGEAVSLGMVMAAHLSLASGYFSQEEIDRIVNILAFYKLPVHANGCLNAEKMLAAMAMDKKHLTTKKQFILMQEIGRAFQCDTVHEKSITQALEALL